MEDVSKGGADELPVKHDGKNKALSVCWILGFGSLSFMEQYANHWIRISSYSFPSSGAGSRFRWNSPPLQRWVQQDGRSVKFGAGNMSAYLFDPEIYTNGRISVPGGRRDIVP
ncbi:hypothetical protein LINPERHAP1_LOCUS8433 [Linum perenne]